jgi:hypothetical protein
VYVAACAPEAGETLGAINARYPDVPLSAALRTFTYTGERSEQATDTFIDAALFHEAMCAEAPADVADTLARTQRPASLAAFGTAVTGTPAALGFPPRRSTRAAGHRPADGIGRATGTPGQRCPLTWPGAVLPRGLPWHARNRRSHRGGDDRL